MVTKKKRTKKEPNLAKEVRRLTDIIQTGSRLRRRFLSGVVFGLGTAIGATVVAGIVIYILTFFFELAGLSRVIK